MIPAAMERLGKLQECAEKTIMGELEVNLCRVYFRIGDRFGLGMDVSKLLVNDPDLGRQVIADLRDLLAKLEEKIGGPQ